MKTEAETSGAAPAAWLAAAPRQLAEMNARAGWSLDAGELAAVQTHFRALKREPTRAEVETLAQTWSEHCKHKTFTSPILYREGKSTKRIKSLLKETIVEATAKLKKPWCLSVFEDNAGIVAFDKKWALAYKVETHNHPCAVEPYGGAETGVGGVVRDVLGAGLGAKPVLNTDVFCFAPPDYDGPLPSGTLHPKRTLTSVVAGVRDYGNRMGIPTAAGGVWFDAEYRHNPLVFVGTVGLLPRSAVKKSVKPGDLIVAAGGRTGRDGLHGATFSSAALDDSASVSAVQIGHAINEKKLLDALLRARDRGLYRGVTDCGAGGFSSAVGEMAALCGARGGAAVDLEKALFKTTEIAPWEAWVSESQERMVFAVPKEKLSAFAEVFSAEGVEHCVLGEFNDSGRLKVAWTGTVLVDLDLEFLHHGVPRRERQAVWETPKPAAKRASRAARRGEAGAALRWCLAHLNVCSREWIIRQYDHEVQAGTVVKPLQGLHHDGPGDATVIWPQAVVGEEGSYRGFGVGHGMNPSYGKLDPYAMAFSCVDEALSNLVCSGADVSQASLLDNFCWGDPEDPKELGRLVRAAIGCRDAALAFGAPFISGKDSLNNTYADAKGAKHSIPGTLLISATAPVPDVRQAVTMDFKTANNSVYMVGVTADELGGSLWEAFAGETGGRVPEVDGKRAKAALHALSAAIRSGLVLSAHDIREGGLVTAAAEMAFSGEVGVSIDLERVPRAKDAADPVTILFSESQSRFLLEVTPEKEKAFLKAMRGVTLARVGQTIANPILRVVDLDSRTLLEERLGELKAAWQRTLPAALGWPGLNGHNGHNGSSR
ncbi:MAG: phosphoribosylformylglycinamidine synthase subunit PurL [Elusimicrobia bacterium]|nr:phosphoribosylformylglycinamidine synthase subunit PurL [Elusimicrobiota bacterium]